MLASNNNKNWNYGETAQTKMAVETIISLDDAPNSEESNYFLVAKDGDRLGPYRKELLMQSELMKTMIEGDTIERDIPIPNVRTAIAKKIMDFCVMVTGTPAKSPSIGAVEPIPYHIVEKPLKSANLAECVPKIFADYIDVDQEVLYEILLGANYLDIKTLLDLCCAKTASMIKGKTPEQIRATFNIVNDFTPSEEAAIVAENKWAEES